MAVVNPTNTEQKTLIKNNGIETAKVTYSDPLQSDALNRDVATDVIVAGIVLSCDNGDIAVKRQKFVFHRVTEFIVSIMTNETRATVSVPNAILARNSTTCNGRINITPVVGTSNAFPINVSPECTVGKDCTILVGDRSGGTTEILAFSPYPTELFMFKQAVMSLRHSATQIRHFLPLK